MGNSQNSIISGFRQKFNFNVIAYLLILLISFLILSPIIFPGVWPRVHDVDRYIILLDHFRDAAFHGIFYPRWLPDMYGGYGYPTFVFYQPGFFFYSLPFSILPGYPLHTMFLTILSLLFLGGAGVYRLCREIAGAFTGLFCSIVFLMTPYIYVNLYVRGDLSELMGMMICPWPLFFLLRLKKKLILGENTTVHMVGIAISLAALILSHPAVALIFLPVFCVVSGHTFFVLKQKKIRFLLHCTASILVAAAISSPYWLTVLKMKGFVNLHRVSQGYFSAENHLVSLYQLFSRNWGFGLSGGNPNGTDPMSFQLGLIHFLLAVTGFWLFRKKTVVRISFILYVFLILLMTPIASVIWIHADILRYIQFPWRILSVVGILQVICISGFQNVFFKKRDVLLTAGISLLILVIMVSWHYRQFMIADNPISNIPQVLKIHRETASNFYHNYAALNEFLPKTAKKKMSQGPRGSTPFLTSNPPSFIQPLEGNTRHRLRYGIETDSPAAVHINQLYFPGWIVKIDGQRIPADQMESNLSDDGRMVIFLEKGRYEVEAFYDGPPGWKVRNIIIGLMILGFMIFCYMDRKYRY